MIQIEWSVEWIALLVSIYILTLVFAAVIARRLDGRRDDYIDLLSKKVEALDEQLLEIKHFDTDFERKLAKVKDDLERLSAQQQKFESVVSERKTFSSESENVLASHAKEINNLHNSIVGLVDAIDEVGLEAIKMELHLARFAIRKGRHQIEEIARNVNLDLNSVAEEELKIEKKFRKSAAAQGEK